MKKTMHDRGESGMSLGVSGVDSIIEEIW